MLTVEVRESLIKGLGVFALRPFPPGEVIRCISLVREITPEAPLRPDCGERHDHCFYPDGRVFLVGFPDRHFNHGCDPNAYTRSTGHSTEVVARRDIKPGEEITGDYLINTAEGDSWSCNCGASRCRGKTGRGFFTLPIEFQCEYLQLLAPWFIRRHRRQVEALTTEASRLTRRCS